MILDKKKKADLDKTFSLVFPIIKILIIMQTMLIQLNTNYITTLVAK